MSFHARELCRIEVCLLDVTKGLPLAEFQAVMLCAGYIPSSRPCQEGELPTWLDLSGEQARHPFL